MKPAAAAALAALVAAGTAGCTAGPDYRLPAHATINAPAAQGAFDGGRDPAVAALPLPDHWWRLYRDPLLDRLIDEALVANTDLRAAEANLRAATAQVRIAEAERTVQTTLSGAETLARPADSGERLPGRVSYDLGGNVAWPLDLAGRIRRSIEAARADADEVAATRDLVRVTVAAGATRAYVAACAANMRIAAADRVLGLQRQTLGATGRLQRGGRGTAFDTTRAQAAVDQSAALVPALRADRQAALYTLAALLGRPPADYPREVAACAAVPQIDRPLPVGDGAALLRRRPDVRAAERALAAATARVGVATAELYPEVSLGGSAGFAGSNGRIGRGRDFSLSLGPLATWTFPNRRAARARIAAAGADADAALAAFDGTVLTALRETETALAVYARARDEVAALTRARASAALAAEQAGKLFRFGRGGFLDLLSAQSTLASAEVTLAAARAGLADDQAQLFLALGGGWE